MTDPLEKLLSDDAAQLRSSFDPDAVVAEATRQSSAQRRNRIALSIGAFAVTVLAAVWVIPWNTSESVATVPPVTEEAFIQAILDGDTPTVEQYLSGGGSPDVTADDGNTAVALAAVRGNIDALRLLIERGVDIEAVGKTNGTPLHLAALVGQTQSVVVLLDNGADAEVANEPFNDSTALLLAVERGHQATVNALIDGGADVEATNNLDQGSIELAIMERAPELALLLLDAGADPSRRTQWGSLAEMADDAGFGELADRLRSSS